MKEMYERPLNYKEVYNIINSLISEENDNIVIEPLAYEVLCFLIEYITIEWVDYAIIMNKNSPNKILSKDDIEDALIDYRDFEDLFAIFNIDNTDFKKYIANNGFIDAQIQTLKTEYPKWSIEDAGHTLIAAFMMALIQFYVLSIKNDKNEQSMLLGQKLYVNSKRIMKPLFSFVNNPNNRPNDLVRTCIRSLTARIMLFFNSFPQYQSHNKQEDDKI